jgi:hypothetical protein
MIIIIIRRRRRRRRRRNGPLARPTRRWVNNIKINLREIG